MFDLTGKGALVTGASGGIGWAIAEALHAQGATIAISGGGACAEIWLPPRCVASGERALSLRADAASS